MNSLHHPHGRGSSRHLVAPRVSAVPLVALTAIVLTVLLLPLAACGRTTAGNTTATPTRTAGPVTTSVAVAGPQLAWQPRGYPAGVDPTRDMPTFSIAPGDGDAAYLCVPPTNPSDTKARTYVTRDRAATWTRDPDLDVGIQPTTGPHAYLLTCELDVDANNPATVLIDEGWVEEGASATIAQFTNYATFDFGAHWQKLMPSQPHPFVAGTQLASAQGNAYAFGTTVIPEGLPQLWFSGDQMHSWRPLTSPAGYTPHSFWVQPETGAILLEASVTFGLTSQLFTSVDGGRSWASLGPAGGSWIVAAPQADQPWRLCNVSTPLYGPPSGGLPDTFSCTEDGGQTWSPPQPEFVYATTYNPKGNGFWVVSEAGIFAIAGDGALLAGGNDTYRLPVGASVWQEIGSAIGSYYPTPDGGVFWLSSQTGFYVASYPAR